MCNATDISNLTVSRSADRLIIYIKTTFNNTLLTLTNEQGQVLTWASAGSCGFKGARKGTPFAAKKVVEIFIKKSTDYLYKCHQIKIYVCGVGPGRENALRGLEKIGYINPTTKQEKKLAAKKTTSPKTQFPKTTSKITSPTPLKALKFSNKIILIREITKIPHNGCRPPKKRRL
uniref:Small ribosomal subunit protein uS11c n=1 Tax=Pseudochlorodesmis sp. HV01306a TaxID=2358488 RepID=A0A386AY13_9CHLO|nr:ribosomal protein S11 [Pseudochlorodesmis sp. HV01306a]